ncbi:MAG: DNA mismatch repair protein MutS [Mariniblastus sp.]|nr:DNA mismatch repair protein MutS [Mariniblastus sp.]
MSKTPMMRQYDEAKKLCGDALLLFRMGDFYELFHQDAVTTSKVLGLTLTSRDKGENAIAMAGFPYHQLDSYMGKLIKQGFRVAVCEQVEDPKTAKGLVKREVQQVVSPGTVTDESLLEPTESNYLAAVVSDSGTAKVDPPVYGVAWIELSTGRFVATVAKPEKVADILARLDVREILCLEGEMDFVRSASSNAMLTTRPGWSFALDHASNGLLKQFGVSSLEGFGLGAGDRPGIRAAGGILEYLNETQKSRLEHVDGLIPYRPSDSVEIDQATWRSLEISRTIRTGSREGSLFDVIDRCMTPMGSRLLGIWLTSPLTCQQEIEQRHDAVEEMVKNHETRRDLRQLLKGVFDLERLVSRVATGRAAPRDLSAIGKTLAVVAPLIERLEPLGSPWLGQLKVELDPCPDLLAELRRALQDPCPAQLKDGGVLRPGFDAELDAFRELAQGGKQWIAEYQQTICEQTGIPSLKVGYNKVFGYYLEVTHTHRDKIPSTFIRKQTLKNAERYITPELKEYEEKVLSAEEKALELEWKLFDQLRQMVQGNTGRLKSNAAVLANLDVIAGLAELAAAQGYCRPVISDDQSLMIEEGRHPVLDILEPLGAFVPNDTLIDDDRGFLHLITGPNMAGKSTYIRQVALITLLAQIGSFVPAKSAKIGVVDRIFARVGASDELTKGQSTFMVEMTETARILNTASASSLVILDEIGRGTSTYDGVSLAWSIVEYIHDHIGCRTLFATHYHELTDLATQLSGVRNYNVAVKEWEEKIVFLHKIIPGSADRSYGIHVAQLAGVPKAVNLRAEQILEKLESSGGTDQTRESLADRSSAPGQGIQMTLFETATHPIVERLKVVDINELTPIEAIQVLSEWKTEFAEESPPLKAGDDRN